MKFIFMKFIFMKFIFMKFILDSAVNVDALNKHTQALNNAIIRDLRVIKLLILNWDEKIYANRKFYIPNRIFVSTGQNGKMAVLACNRLGTFWPCFDDETVSFDNQFSVYDDLSTLYVDKGNGASFSVRPLGEDSYHHKQDYCTFFSDLNQFLDTLKTVFPTTLPANPVNIFMEFDENKKMAIAE